MLDLIDKIVWFIPIKKLRNYISDFLISIVEKLNNISLINTSILDELKSISSKLDLIIYDNIKNYKYGVNSRNIQVNYLLSIKKELLESSNLTSLKSNNKVIYTCITGKYNNLFVHTYINKDYDYICFTDDPILIKQRVYGNWIIKEIDSTIDYDNIRINRYYKMHPHLILSEYEYSLYIDANIDIKTTYIFDCIENCIKNNIYLSIPKHYERNCIYDEAIAVINAKIDSEDIVNKQMKLYREIGFPANYGLAENNCIFRFHNNDTVISIMNDWWNIFINYSKRDQLSLFFVIWKYKYDFKYLTDSPIRLDTLNFEFFYHNKLFHNLTLDELGYKYGNRI